MGLPFVIRSDNTGDPMSETEVLTNNDWESYARRVEQETMRRYGSSLPCSCISLHAGHMIVEIGPEDQGSPLTVRHGWKAVMRKAARQTGPRPRSTPIPGLGERMRTARTAQGLSLSQMARDINVQRPNLDRIERGVTKDPNVSIVWRYARRLKVTVESLCEHAPTKQENPSHTGEPLA